MRNDEDGLLSINTLISAIKKSTKCTEPPTLEAPLHGREKISKISLTGVSSVLLVVPYTLYRRERANFEMPPGTVVKISHLGDSRRRFARRRPLSHATIRDHQRSIYGCFALLDEHLRRRSRERGNT